MQGFHSSLPNDTKEYIGGPNRAVRHRRDGRRIFGFGEQVGRGEGAHDGQTTHRIKKLAVTLLQELKAKQLRVDRWREKESIRDDVLGTICDFLRSDTIGLPVNSCTMSEDVFRCICRAYPTVLSPYYWVYRTILSNAARSVPVREHRR